MQDIYNVDLDELNEYFIKKNEKAYKTKQVYDWLYKKRVSSFKDMSNLKKEMIGSLETDFVFGDIEVIKKQKGDNVYKYLFKLNDGEKIEAVVMFHDYGISLCISTQVGCNMGCTFCESGRLKKVRNLTAGEMVLQILKVESDIDKRISHIVLMGIGEPFDNYDNVMKFIKIVNNPFGIDIGARHITVSTSGVIPRIYDFAKSNLQVNLAISLHAPNDEIRSIIMPLNKIYNIKELIKSVKEYIKITNRRITFEYIMLDQINDSKECALELASLLKGINCYVNLIAYNETQNLGFKKSKKDTIKEFYDILKKNKINVTIRKEFGSEVDAACGQLRSLN